MAAAPIACIAPAPAEEDVAQAEGALADGELASCTPQKVAPDPPDKCGNYMHLACGLPDGVKPTTNCYLWLNDCHKICPGLYFNCHLTDASCKDGVVAKGPVDVDCSICAKGVGRIPEGLARASARRTGSAVADWLASVAHLEAAAVHAFRRLHAELTAHGAPADLLAEVRRARRDEVRHAQQTGRLARRRGGSPPRPVVRAVAARPLDEVAIENAVEGCVRETYGALVATYQAGRAENAAIARVMAGIARDETRHAALSWAIARWAWPRLDEGARARLRERQREAIAALLREADADADVDPRLAAEAGVPDAARQRAMLLAMSGRLFQR